VLVRTSPWADIISTGTDVYGPMTVEIDGKPHTLDVDVESCDMD
jgi:hypothetical protein